jgi:predicted HAD superfamily Cof-like phosphohydrolase
MAAEIRRLQARERELLEHNTRLVEERRALDRQVMVRHFFRVAGQGHDMPERPTVPEGRSLRLGLRLVVEEFFELLRACLGHDGRGMRIDGWVRPPVESEVAAYVAACALDVDLPKLVDAVIDLAYVLEGLAIRCGVDTRPLFVLVHEANLTKQGGPVNEHGKRGKPPGFVPPDVAAALRDQGWAGCSSSST